jgi:uncharacterized membrane protein YhaH (DUF805 family)
MNYYIEVLKNYAQFSGRARRSEYWYFALFSGIISVVLSIIGVVMKLPLLGNIYSLAVLLPSIAVGVRRMHDVNKSGWFILIPIYNLILACTDGTPGDNQYGPDPKNRNGFGADDYQRPVDYNTPQ